ncbi:hypothetical protein ACRALDRAFT_207587 [Sodiomyces alcalophilus JCM 7366]|uniref:uncharacterized protein n=1 Tax=Sodiomyces alcalophilus JCM 7366 TaxID=591952 RepID=UPI0039B4708C
MSCFPLLLRQMKYKRASWKEKNFSDPWEGIERGDGTNKSPALPRLRVFLLIAGIGGTLQPRHVPLLSHQVRTIDSYGWRGLTCTSRSFYPRPLGITYFRQTSPKLEGVAEAPEQTRRRRLSSLTRRHTTHGQRQSANTDFDRNADNFETMFG